MCAWNSAYERLYTEIIGDFMTEYSEDSLRAFMHEECCFDYLITMLASEERYFHQLACVTDDTFCILERTVALETRDRVADATLATKPRHDWLLLRCAAGWVCAASGVTGLEDADGDPCARELTQD